MSSNSLDLDYAEVVWNPEAERWQVTHRGELVLDGAGHVAVWLDYSAAHRAKLALDPKPAYVPVVW